jgi:hypothetical protein
MGRQRTSRRSTAKNKKYKKQHCTARRRKDIDQIQDDVAKEMVTGKPMAFELDEDLPGSVDRLAFVQLLCSHSTYQ